MPSDEEMLNIMILRAGRAVLVAFVAFILLWLQRHSGVSLWAPPLALGLASILQTGMLAVKLGLVFLMGLVLVTPEMATAIAGAMR